MDFKVIDEFATVLDYLPTAKEGDRVYLTYQKTIPSFAKLEDTYKVDSVDLKKNILQCSGYYKHKVYRVIGKMLNQRLFLVKSTAKRQPRTGPIQLSDLI